MEFEQILEQFLSYLSFEKALSVNSVQAYKNDLKKYFVFLKNSKMLSLKNITDSIIEEFVSNYASTKKVIVRTTHLKKKDTAKSPEAKSVARVVASVRAFHKFAFEEGYTLVNPAELITAPKLPKSLPHALSIPEVEKLINMSNITNTTIEIRDQALLEFMYSTGARVSEVVNLTVDDIDLDCDYIKVFGKGSKMRLVPLGSYAKKAMTNYLTNSRSTLLEKANLRKAIGAKPNFYNSNNNFSDQKILFLNKRGRPISRQTIWEILQYVSGRAEIRNISPHTLRHSFASHMLQGGADIRVVQELLGHTNVVTTQIYTYISPETLKEVYITNHPRAF
ncbi:MAG: site-specific tyrosine recombinase XerD [Bifidobacteriaceae bacterium]|jgi:integrase/recombinase XerD|nr:site-specific tyrosine recombinase XerD [Bifidobacteriaceae bacterium]